MNKKAFITGITGQDGAYLAAFLLSLGYVVYGGYRRTSSDNFWRIHSLGIAHHPNLILVEHDLLDFGGTLRLLQTVEPDEVYNLAAQSFVAVSFDQPNTTLQTNGVGALNLLEGIRTVNPGIKFYQASTSEMFGKTQSTAERLTENHSDTEMFHKTPNLTFHSSQTENTPFYPRSPYGAAKLYAHWMTVNYRESYGIFAVSGILFNHESPLRGHEFVTRKITHGIARIKLGLQKTLVLGNLMAQRDWGYAKEYVEGMYKMLQAPTPDNYILATNRTETVQTFVTLACKALDIDLAWEGQGLDVQGIDRKTGKTIVKLDPKLYRPAEVDVLRGDASKAKSILGWEPKTSLEELCRLMVEADLKRNETALRTNINSLEYL